MYKRQGLIVGLFLYKEMDFKCLINSCIESCETSAVIIVLMAMATLFGNIMTIEDVPGTVAMCIRDRHCMTRPLPCVNSSPRKSRPNCCS